MGKKKKRAVSETACVSSLRMAMLAAVCAALVVCYSSAASEAEEAVRTSPLASPRCISLCSFANSPVYRCRLDRVHAL